jgi:hypothetical protein
MLVLMTLVILLVDANIPPLFVMTTMPVLMIIVIRIQDALLLK